VFVISANAPRFLLYLVKRKAKPKSWLFIGDGHKKFLTLKRIYGETTNLLADGFALEKVSRRQRTIFVAWIDSISQENYDNTNWFFSSASVKNTFVSKLFLRTCFLEMFEELKDDGKQIDLVIIESKALAEFVHKKYSTEVIYPQYNRILFFSRSIETFVINAKNGLSFFVNFVKKWYWQKTVLDKKIINEICGKDKLVFIRHYIVKEFSSQNYMFWKHCFPGLPEYLVQNGYTPVFIPVVAQVKKYKSVFENIIKSRQKIVLPEEFLGLKDILGTLLSGLIFWVKHPRPTSYMGESYDALLEEELAENLFSQSFLTGVLYSRVGEKMANMKVTPVSVINWNENQAFEKGLLAGMKKQFPGMILIAAQPFIAPLNLLSIHQSRQDSFISLHPERTLVLGPKFRKEALEYDPKLAVSYSPSFRDSLSELDTHQSGSDRILVALGYDFFNSVTVLRLLSDSWGQLADNGGVTVRLHPASSFNYKDLLVYLDDPPPEEWLVSESSLMDDVKEAKWAICGATGTSVELVINGLSVVVVGECQALTFNYLEHLGSLPEWRLCFSKDDLLDADKIFSKENKKEDSSEKQLASEIRSDLFIENPENYWTQYLPLKNSDLN